MDGRALVGRAGGGLGNVEVEVCLGSKFGRLMRLVRVVKPCLGKGCQTECCGTKGMAGPGWRMQH